MRFSGENRSHPGALSKQGFLPCLSTIRNSKRRTRSKSFKIAQKTVFEAKGQQHIAGEVIQR